MSALLPIFLIVLVDLLAMMMIVPLLPFYAQRFGASPVEIGLLASSFAVCQLVAAPLLGRLSDRVGRRPVLVLSQLGTCLGFVLMLFATKLWVLFLARVIDGVTAGNLPIAQAYIADATPPGARARAFGIIGVAFGLGLVLGPAASGLLASYDWNYPILCAAALSFLSMIVTWTVLPPETARSTEERAGALSTLTGYFKSRAVAPLLLQFFVFVFAFAYFAQGLGLFAQGRFTYGPTEIGYLMAYCGVLGIVIQGFLIGRLARRFGEARLARLGFLADAGGYLALGLATTPEGLVAACTLFSFGNSTLRPSLTSLISQRVRREDQGAVLGITGSLQSVGQIVAPPLGGLLIERGWLTGWGVVLAAIAGLGFFTASGKET